MTETSVTDLLDTLRQSFLDELPTRIELIEDKVLSLKNHQDDNDELFRIVHSLKGSAGSYNLHIISKISHYMEDVMLSLLKEDTLNNPSSTATLLSFVDLLKNTVSSLINKTFSEDSVDKALAELHQQIFKKSYEILVVEPSKLYAGLIEYGFSEIPAKITYIRDGFQALELLLIKKYHLLITAMETPPLNADALISALRLTHTSNRDMKVVLLTSTSKEKIKHGDKFDLIFERNLVRDKRFSETMNDLLSK